MNRRWIPWLFVGTITFTGFQMPFAQAQSLVAISADRAQGLVGVTPVVHLWSGYGTNLSFLPTNERIVQVWIDDPARVALDFDEPLCPAAAESDCVSGNPSVIHLRRIQGLDFEPLPSASGTLLTVITEATNGDRRLYEFRIEFGDGDPDYHTVAVQPSSPIHSLFGPGDVRRGLEIAASRDLIHPEQDLWNRLQTFLELTQQGLEIPVAAEQAGVSLELITQLADWGARARDDPPLTSTDR